MITDADKQFCGKSAPDFYYSLSLRAEYKGFDLELFFNGEQGKKIFNYAQREALAPQSVFQNIERNLANNSWTPEHINAKYQEWALPTRTATETFSPTAGWKMVLFYVYKTFQLGYTLPKNLLSKNKNKQFTGIPKYDEPVHHHLLFAWKSGNWKRSIRQ